MGGQTEQTTVQHQPVGGWRRAFGLLMLFGVHLWLLIWSLVWSLFAPRYRKVTRFQLRYFRDVLARERHTKAEPGGNHSP